jgi:hypothetical protein
VWKTAADFLMEACELFIRTALAIFLKMINTQMGNKMKVRPSPRLGVVAKRYDPCRLYWHSIAQAITEL